MLRRFASPGKHLALFCTVATTVLLLRGVLLGIIFVVGKPGRMMQSCCRRTESPRSATIGSLEELRPGALSTTAISLWALLGMNRQFSDTL